MLFHLSQAFPEAHVQKVNLSSTADQSQMVKAQVLPGRLGTCRRGCYGADLRADAKGEETGHGTGPTGSSLASLHPIGLRTTKQKLLSNSSSFSTRPVMKTLQGPER